MIISSNLKECTTFLDQIFGLLLPTNPRTLLFRTRLGIHTFGLKVPIDIVVLDSTNHVVQIKKNLHPWSVFFWNPRYNTIIELPSGSIDSFKITIGDRLKLSKRIK